MLSQCKQNVKTPNLKKTGEDLAKTHIKENGYKDVGPNHRAEHAGQWQVLVNKDGNEHPGSTKMTSFFTSLANISFTRAKFHRNYHDHTQQHQMRRRPN
jgi:hypothetical protein